MRENWADLPTGRTPITWKIHLARQFGDPSRGDRCLRKCVSGHLHLHRRASSTSSFFAPSVDFLSLPSNHRLRSLYNAEKCPAATDYPSILVPCLPSLPIHCLYPATRYFMRRQVAQKTYQLPSAAGSKNVHSNTYAANLSSS